MPFIPDLRPVPPTVVGPTTKKATRPTNILPQSLIDEARVIKKEDFNPNKHLIFQPPKGITTMKEIGLEGREAIKQIQSEVFSEAVLRDCQYSSSFTKNMVRGMGRERAPFTCDAWSSEELRRIVSSVADIDLDQAFDYEKANINIALNEGSEVFTDVKVQRKPETSAFGWHFDSFPICGTAVIMQGRYIEHQALKAFGGLERISMVTPSDRGIYRNWSELYHGFTEYRLELLEEPLRLKMKEEQKRVDSRRPFNITDMTAFLKEQISFMQATVAELIPVEEME
ncbi:hypothetical protein N7493_006970 [Penicillium malachiteum]|uniref:Uncharacterized protein n=1 Tax=Penicillium malachiteum TaxID=1324776 RepID=A0AAD6HK29_9EURO|nr:hypothetical protein N7493_006970 [Penicillium malachiteum]